MIRLVKIVGLLLICATAASPQEVGPVTELPIPRYVSLKSSPGNLRRGPSFSQRIDWVLMRRGMPLRVTAEYDNWRRVVDRDGVGGWVYYTLLSGNRTVIVDAETLSLHARPDSRTTEIARLERGVVARVDECTEDWCRLVADGYRGWAPKGNYWGVEPDEVFD
ncbi:SH3 domain-containing protein [Roseisalinus antarcticus]|uniref:Bacterial SH3 domain protein n=1 Tax=Roseisalinus antarcticus TaxID=254357 RepID=A0A1Y5SE04_9RHOB|nr:SH3 domain-containing protein [Roseisalinus antarcticus]SLN38203.1 Bacterial SH3 domain protein [Roseisalinus antarcticus]